MTINLDKYNLSEMDRFIFVETINDILRSLSTENALDFSKRFSVFLVMYGFLIWHFPNFGAPNMSMEKMRDLCIDITTRSIDIAQRHGLEKLKAYLEGFDDYIARQV